MFNGSRLITSVAIWQAKHYFTFGLDEFVHTREPNLFSHQGLRLHYTEMTLMSDMFQFVSLISALLVNDKDTLCIYRICFTDRLHLTNSLLSVSLSLVTPPFDTTVNCQCRIKTSHLTRRENVDDISNTNLIRFGQVLSSVNFMQFLSDTKQQLANA